MNTVSEQIDAQLERDQQRLADFIEKYPRLLVLTGAGCSTDSGIPDYRDGEGAWKRPPPVTYQAFMGEDTTRRRYWARSLVGWRRFGQARPNVTHLALARLEQQGRISLLITQNVDRLHQAAGSQHVVDLHGRLDQVRCMQCEWRLPRAEFQHALETANPRWRDVDAADAPDGDADLDGLDFSTFQIPCCPRCRGVLKPDVVFFGENVPRERVDAGMQAVDDCDAMLVVGSSLMVYSGYRFAYAASRAGKPLAALNLGRTRADPMLDLKLDQPCATLLRFVL